MSVKNRLKIFVKSEKITISEFEKDICVANGYVNSISKSIGIDKIKLILEKYPMLNLEWLFTGSGEMLKKTIAEPQNADLLYKVIQENGLLHEKIGRLENEIEQLKKDIENKVFDYLDIQSALNN